MKKYLITADGFELGIITKKELKLLEKTDTKHFDVTEIETNVFSSLIKKIENKIPFYKLTYTYETKEFSIDEVKDIVDINLNYACDLYDNNDYTQILYSGFAKNEIEKEKLLEKFKKHVKYITSLTNGSVIEKYCYKHSKPKIYKKIELVDNHKERTIQEHIKSDLMFEQLKKMMMK